MGAAFRRGRRGAPSGRGLGSGRTWRGPARGELAQGGLARRRRENSGRELWKREIDVKLFAILFVLAAAVMAGLYAYGQMLEPETRLIEVEAFDVER